MFTLAAAAAAAVAVVAAAARGADTGVLELDDHTFAKLVGTGQFNVLVEFVEYSWKASENYKDVAEAFVDDASVLVAKVDTSLVKDEALKAARTAGDGDDEKAVARLYAKDGSYEVFAGDVDDPQALIDFVQSNLSAEQKRLRALAAEYVGADATRRAAIADEAAKIGAGAGDDKSLADAAKVYVAYMKRIDGKGDAFVGTERERLSSLIESSSVAAAQKNTFKRRRAILEKFATA
mmetsp:Transcript_50483/g.124088  ORF Transcript_50483/g.124088 Transcript_50483/m.124088 type:complete len:236 (-) Transcript_50483:131-838(-)